MSEENAGISICRRNFSQGSYSNIIFPLDVFFVTHCSTWIHFVDTICNTFCFFSSSSNAIHKCKLLDEEIPSITYNSGGTYTLGALQQALEVLSHSRKQAARAIFLITGVKNMYCYLFSSSNLLRTDSTKTNRPGYNMRMY